jgi:hypothetical protein
MHSAPLDPFGARYGERRNVCDRPSRKRRIPVYARFQLPQHARGPSNVISVGVRKNECFQDAAAFTQVRQNRASPRVAAVPGGSSIQQYPVSGRGSEQGRVPLSDVKEVELGAATMKCW